MAQHRAPFVSLWSRDDVRSAVCDFLPTILIEDPSPQTSYTIDARFRHESVTCALGKADVSVNGRLVIGGLPFNHQPLEKLDLYNLTRGRVHVGPIEVWYEEAAPNQVW